jgi:hypothetical protein
MKAAGLRGISGVKTPRSWPGLLIRRLAIVVLGLGLLASEGRGKRGRLGVAAVADRVLQASLKLVLEPIFEVDCMIKGRSALRLLFAPAHTR